MSETCPRCHARVGRCDCHDTDSEMIAERIADIEQCILLLTQAILDEERMDRDSWFRTVLRLAAKEARDLIRDPEGS